MNIPLSDFAKTKILVVGDLILDRYYFGNTTRISSDAPVPIVNIDYNNDCLGGAGNVALNLASLGAQTTVIGLAGDDASSHILIQQLNKSYIRHEILQIKEIQTMTKIRIICQNQQLIRLDFEEKIPVSHSMALIDIFKKHFKSVDIIILSDYGKGTLACARELMELANAFAIPVLVDPKGIDFT